MPAISESKIMITGYIFDAETMNPIKGAIIEVQTVYPRKSAKTAFNGGFVMKGLPLGIHKIVVEAEGYEYKEVHSIELTKEKTYADLHIELNKGKNTTAELEAIGGSALLKSKQPQKIINIELAARDRPINDMAIVSLRSFNREEMMRFAGSRNDPSRAISNYAGMRTQDDYNNNLIARGNSSTNFQWRVEGIPMPNANHLGDFNQNGGMANVFSPRAVNQSDVMLGAFAAEYGNVVGGVFDARLREKSVDKIRFSGQINSATGVEAMVEGQTRPADNSGYFFINYRLSKLNYISGLMASGIHAEHGHPNQMPSFQDLSFKAVYPMQSAGTLTLFGLGGLASQNYNGEDSSRVKNNQFVQWGEEQELRSAIAITGLKHRIMLKEERHSHSYLETTVATTFLQNRQQHLLWGENNDTAAYKNLLHRKQSLFAGLKYHYKIDHKLSMRAGILNESIFFNLNSQEQANGHVDLGHFQTVGQSNTNLFQAYSMFLFKPMINFKANLGMNFQWLALTNSWSIEPRMAFRWEFSPLHFFSFGYGKHSQMQPLEAYYSQDLSGNELSYNGGLNKLGFTHAHHFVIGYDYWIDNNWRLHAELYHEEFTNVPVDSSDKVFSMLNYNGANLGDISHLVNEGEGYMQGFEISVERYFDQGFYFLASTSIFTAKYSDYLGRERHLSTNNRVIVNFVAGKSIPFGENEDHRFNIDLRASYSGRRNSGTISPVASFQANQTVFEPSYGMNTLTDPYFRADLKLSLAFNNPVEETAHTVFIDILNITNSRNSNGQYFDRFSQSIQHYRQMPILVDFGYAFQF
jgi:hypothetical protein